MCRKWSGVGRNVIRVQVLESALKSLVPVVDIQGARHALDGLADRTERAIDLVESDLKGDAAPTLVVAGVVAANSAIRARPDDLVRRRGWRLVVPPAKYCTDNGAMVAWTGIERIRAGLAPAFEAALAFAPRARWPLAAPIAGREHGGGKKGPKA